MMPEPPLGLMDLLESTRASSTSLGRSEDGSDGVDFNEIHRYASEQALYQELGPLPQTFGKEFVQLTRSQPMRVDITPIGDMTFCEISLRQETSSFEPKSCQAPGGADVDKAWNLKRQTSPIKLQFQPQRRSGRHRRIPERPTPEARMRGRLTCQEEASLKAAVAEQQKLLSARSADSWRTSDAADFWANTLAANTILKEKVQRGVREECAAASCAEQAMLAEAVAQTRRAMHLEAPVKRESIETAKIDMVGGSLPEIRFCPHCSASIQPFFQFCPKCGRNLELLRAWRHDQVFQKRPPMTL
jgi:hypothetical protein